MFGPGSSFFVWVRGMGGGTNGQSASGAAAGAEFFCGVLGDGVASALWWMAAGAEFPCDVLGGGVASALRWMWVG